MWIKKLFLTNVKAYPKAEIEFSKSINLLIGENNSGKSTILKSIYRLQNNHISNTDDIRKTFQTGKVLIHLEDLNDFQKSFLSKEIGNSGMTSIISDTNRAINIKLIQNGVHSTFSTIGNEDFTHSKAIEFKGFSDTEGEGSFIYPFFSQRKVYTFGTNQSGQSNTYRIGYDFSNLPAKIKKITSLSFPYRKAFEKACEDILGFTVGNVPGRENEDKIGIYVNGSSTIQIEAMGEGVLNIVGMLVILFTENKKLFLIEELENDIHPKALKKLLKLIIDKSKENQFIISTHSNIVLKYLGGLNDAKIFETKGELKIDKVNQTEIPTSSITELLNTSDERLRALSDLGYDLFDSDLWEGFLIFEESSAESVIREVLIKEFVPSLETRLQTIGAKGADDAKIRFIDLHRLLLYCHLSPIYKHKAWIILDGDQKGLDNIMELKSTFTDWPSDRFQMFTKFKFEDYYPKKFQDKTTKIFANKDPKKRQKQKGELAKEVIKWAKANPKTARKEFEISAHEVINLLKDIAKNFK